MKSLLLLFTLCFFTASTFAQNNSLHFDGVDDIVVGPSSTVFETTEGTVDLWLKPKMNANKQTFITYRSNDGFQTRFNWSFLENLDGIGFWNGALFDVRFFTFTPDQWYHIAFVYDPAGFEVYINGNLEMNFTINVGTATGPALNLVLGVDFPCCEFYEGEMDELRIWSVAKTPSEISDLMICSYPSNEPALILNYKFDEGIAEGNNTALNTTEDSSSNGFDGTLTNFNQSGATSNWVVSTTNPIPDPTPTGSYFNSGLLYNNGSTVLPASDVELISDFSIDLEIGTDVQLGANFHAFIGGCLSGMY